MLYEHTDDSVVVIIGSGAGGGTLANALCQKGIDVVLLEAGKQESIGTFVNDEWASFEQLAWRDKRTTSGSWRIARDFPNLPAWTCKTVGGTTTHWAGASLRLRAHEFMARTVYGDIDGAEMLDWPLNLAELEPFYRRAEDRMGVTRTNDIPGLPGNNNFRVFYNGAKRIGYRDCHTGRMAINSEPRDGRASCRQLGFCFQGCKMGAKWSTLYTEIPAAAATGKFELRRQCHAARIEHDPQGRATGVVYFDSDGNEQRQRARIVCVAGNAIETPRLLLLSESSRFPDGLANSSGEVGRNYQRHTTGSVFAAFDDPIHMYRGTTMAGIITEESGHQPGRGFAGGYELETVALGLPVANVHYDDHANDIAMRNHAYAQGRALYESIGAKRVIETPPYPSTHNLGTCRMSEDPLRGVVNKWGQAHDIPNLFISDGSQFTTSAAVNPTLTIVALALRQADLLALKMAQREL